MPKHPYQSDGREAKITMDNAFPDVIWDKAGRYMRELN